MSPARLAWVLAGLAVLALPAASAFPDLLPPGVAESVLDTVEGVPVAGPWVPEWCYHDETFEFCTHDAEPFLGIEEEADVAAEENATRPVPAENATVAPAPEEAAPMPETVEEVAPFAALPAPAAPQEPSEQAPALPSWEPSPTSARVEPLQKPEAGWGWALAAAAAAAVAVPWALALKLSLLLLRRRQQASPMRDAVLRAVLQRPGIRHRELVLLIGRGNGTVEHHLQHLMRDGKVVQVRGPKSTSYFGHGAVSPELVRVLPALRRKTALAVARAVAAAPGVRATEVARRVGVSLPTVSYHAKILAERGLVQAGPAGLLLTKLGADGLALVGEDAEGAPGVSPTLSGPSLRGSGQPQASA